MVAKRPCPQQDCGRPDWFVLISERSLGRLPANGGRYQTGFEAQQDCSAPDWLSDCGPRFRNRGAPLSIGLAAAAAGCEIPITVVRRPGWKGSSGVSVRWHWYGASA